MAPAKSDLRNHCATVQPRLYSCAMVTQITLNTEGSPGLPSDARLRRLIRSAPLKVRCGEVLSRFHLSRLQRSHTRHSRICAGCANAPG
jgi:hypothetical protein